MDDETKKPRTNGTVQGKAPCPHPSARSHPGPHPCPPHYPFGAQEPDSSHHTHNSPRQPFSPNQHLPNQHSSPSHPQDHPFHPHPYPPNHTHAPYYYPGPPRPPEKDSLVLIIVVLLVLVIILPMVLAAGLFLMVQDIGHDGWDVDSLFIHSYETEEGWRISVLRGELAVNPSVDWYLLSPGGARVGDRHNDTLASPPGTLFTHMDYNSNGYLDSGDAILINDPAHQYRGYSFHIYTNSFATGVSL